MPISTLPRAAACAAALSLAAATAPAGAQDFPPPPPPPIASIEVPDTTAVDDRLRFAVHLLGARQTDDAVAVLGRIARERHVDPLGYDAVAVLLRLGAARLRPGTPTEGSDPRRSPPGADVAVGELPPPPSDEAVRARVIDGAVERLARWDLAGARLFLDSAVDFRAALGADAVVIEALRALSGAPASSGHPAVAYEPPPPPRALLPDRPPGTIEGFEVLSLYFATTGYGFALGTWAGLAVTNDDRSALRLVLPIAGLSAGLVGAIVLDRSRTVRRGRGYAFNAGAVLGGLAGAAAVLYARPGGDAAGWGFAAGGATLGIGAALGLAHAVDALPGTVNYVTSAGLWGSMIGLTLSLAAERDGARQQATGTAMLIGEGAGIVLAVLSAGSLRPTPAQTRWADLGACAGGSLGGTLMVSTNSPAAIGVGMALGILGGGVLAWFLAAPDDAQRAAYLQRSADRGPQLRFGVSPLPGGGLLHVGM